MYCCDLEMTLSNKMSKYRLKVTIDTKNRNPLPVTRTVNFIGLSRFLQTVSSHQDNTDNVEIGNYPLRSTRYQ